MKKIVNIFNADSLLSGDYVFTNTLYYSPISHTNEIFVFSQLCFFVDSLNSSHHKCIKFMKL